MIPAAADGASGGATAIYCPAMNGDRPTLPQRVTAVLHARQYVVFFAIILFSLDVAVPIFSAWLYRGAELAELLNNTWGPLADAVAARSVVIAGLFVAYLLLKTWLRAGYVRSLTGPFHIGAADRRQFVRLLGLELLLEAVAAAAVGVIVLAGDRAAVAGVVVIVLLAFYLAVIYADYIVVLGDVGPIRAIVLSWRTVRSAFLPSALVLLTVSLAGDAASQLLSDEATTSLSRAAPLLLVQCVVMGAIVFVADVVLVVVYLRAVEDGRLKPRMSRPSRSTRG